MTVFLLLALGGAALAVCALGRTTYQWHGLAVELRLLPAATGQTWLVLTPVGTVTAHTHAAPIALVASLEEVQVDQIQALLRSVPKRSAVAADFTRTARRDLRNFITRQLLFAGLGALLAPLCLRSRRSRLYLAAPAIGAGSLALLLASALTTFNGKAFEAPTYSGALKQAPWVVQFGKDAFTKIEALSLKLKTVAENLNVLYGRISTLPGALASGDGPDTVRVLHISDIHNNYAALAFVREVASDFHVAFIVDTGDLTDFGSPPETAIVQEIGKLPYPYVFVAGNHDSRAVTSALGRLPNVTVLDGSFVTVEGFRIAGVPNPASLRAGVGSVDTTADELAAGGQQLLRLIQANPPPPDIVAVHDPQESRPLWGITPLVLCGHLHRAYIEVVQNQAGAAAGETPQAPLLAHPAGTTVLCNAGTTGAAGLRYFEREAGVPFSCAVLTFRYRRPPERTLAAPPPAGGAQPGSTAPSGTQMPAQVTGRATRAGPAVPTAPQLVAIDQIQLDGSLGDYSISHHIVGGAALPASP